MPAIVRLTAALETEPVSGDPDDPAIWVDVRKPERSLILGTNKVSAAEGGALYAFSLSGKIVGRSVPLDRPNNVAVVKNWAVVTERLKNRLCVLSLPYLRIVGEIPCAPEPMGVATWDDSVVVGQKKSPATNPLTRYKLREVGGRVVGDKIATFGSYSGKKEIEAIAVDTRRRRVYYGDETFGVRVWERGREIGILGAEFQGDHEGIAVFGNYVACTDQIPLAQGGSRLHVFDQRTLKPAATFETGADETDGIDICTKSLGALFPGGLFVAMNSGPKNFRLYDLRDLLQALSR